MSLGMKLYLANLAEMARNMGKTEKEIRAAIEECERIGNDTPFRELIMPDMLAVIKRNDNG